MEADGRAIDLTGKQKELTSELAAASLDNALDSCDVESFMKLLGEVIKARLGYGAMARSAGLNRTALYKIASPKGNPAFHTLVSLLTPLGLRLSIKVITGQPAGTRPELSDVAASQSSNGAYAESSAEKNPQRDRLCWDRTRSRANIGHYLVDLAIVHVAFYLYPSG